jgi:hypothetical protein
MRYAVFVELSIASAKLGKSRRDVVVMLLMKVMKDVERLKGGFTLVRYQERDPLKQWHCFSISFRREENEFFTDLRKLGKFSVSYLVAIAAELYMDDLLNERGGMHNYAAFAHYAVGQRAEGGIICWELYWGDPDDIPAIAGTTRIHRRTSAS